MHTRRRRAISFGILVIALSFIAATSFAAPDNKPPGGGDPKHGAKTKPSTRPSERGSAEAAAKGFIEALKKRDEDALAGVIAAGDDGSAVERAKLTLKGKGSFRGIVGVIGKGEKIWTGKLEASPADVKPPVARVHLLRKGKRGDDRSAGSLEVIKAEDGWRVNDWDMPH
jgi:hypothetical protein